MLLYASAYRFNLKLFLDSGNWEWKQNPDTRNSLDSEEENILHMGTFLYNLWNKDRPWQFAICHVTVRRTRNKALLKIEF
jgi:hypothetical protein